MKVVKIKIKTKMEKRRSYSPRYRRDVGSFDTEDGHLLDGWRLFVHQDGFGEEPC